MKINDIIKEGWQDVAKGVARGVGTGALKAVGAFSPEVSQALAQAGAMKQRQADTEKYQSQQQVKGMLKPNPARAAQTQTQATTDIRDSLPDTNTQFRFANPTDNTIAVIIRKDGYYFSKPPQGLQQPIKKDPATGLYPVLRPENIQKINAWYDDAADKKLVTQEPVHAI